MTPEQIAEGRAERVEAAAGANYALEVAIFKAMHPEYAGYVEGRGGLVHPYDGSDVRVLSDVRPGNYTASIDAAMTLVPEGMAVEITTTGYKPGATVCGTIMGEVHEGAYAALRARAAIGGGA